MLRAINLPTIPISIPLPSPWWPAWARALTARSNRKLDNWVKHFQGKGYKLYLADFRPANSLMKAKTFTKFETLLSDHKVTEAYWHWTQMVSPSEIVYGKIWFTDKETTYYVDARAS